MSWLSQALRSMMHPEQGYKAGADEMNNYYNQAQGYMNPYLQNFGDPTKLQADWIKSYETSPAAQQAMQMAQGQGADAAASMGLLGSNTALNTIQEGASNIAMRDRQNYLNDLMQKYFAGSQMAQGMGQNAMNQGQNMAQMRFGQQNAPGNMMSNLLQGGMGLGLQAYGMSQLPKWNPVYQGGGR